MDIFRQHDFRILLVLSLACVFVLPVAGQERAKTADAAVKAEALITHGKNDEALGVLKELAETAPTARGVQAKLGKAYYEKRMWSQATTHLELAIRQDPADGESYQLLGLSYFMNGRQRDAIPILENVQSRLPRPDATGTYLVGVASIQTYQYDKARIAFAKMFSVPPESGAAHMMLAKMMIRHDFNDQAVPELRKAIELDPKLAMAHFLLGELYLLRGKTDAAVEEFKKELEIDPMMWLTYWRMGEAYTHLDQWNLAEEALKKAIWLNQNFTGPYVMMGKVQLEKGNPDVAAEFLEHAREMDPNNPDAHFLLGRAYQRLGRNEESKRELELAQKIRDATRPRLESVR